MSDMTNTRYRDSDKGKILFFYVTFWVLRTDANFLSDINYMIIVYIVM